jgi:phage head maturation protease
LLALIEGGIVRGSSFAFTIARDGEQWTVDENGRHIRTITRVGDLFDVGPVTYPAYGDGGLDVARRSFDTQARKAQKRAEATVKLALRTTELKAKHADLTEWLKANAAR